MAITFKKLSGDTEVVANPVLDGTETALSGLQIDGVKYAMGGGGLYRHRIYSFKSNMSTMPFDRFEFWFDLYSSNPNPMTNQDVYNYLKAFKTSKERQTVFGSYRPKDSEESYKIEYAYFTSSGYLQFYFDGYETTRMYASYFGVTDTVTQII